MDNDTIYKMVTFATDLNREREERVQKGRFYYGQGGGYISSPTPLPPGSKSLPQSLPYSLSHHLPLRTRRKIIIVTKKIK